MIILALVCIILFMVFMVVNAKKAMNQVHTDNEELSKKLQQVTFDLHEAERKSSHGEDEIMNKLSEQEKQLAETEKNFKHALNSKNEYISQLTLRLKEYESANAELVRRVKMLLNDANKHRSDDATSTDVSSLKQTDQPTTTTTTVNNVSYPKNTQTTQLSETNQNTRVNTNSGNIVETEYDSVSEPSTFPSSMFSTSVKETVVAEHIPV